jgi:HK97 family phage portal protein
MATIGDRFRALFRTSGVAYQDTTVSQHFNLRPTVAGGIAVTETSALSISTVYACINKIASTVAALGLDVYTTDGDNVEVANMHPAHLIVKDPNRNITAFEFWETMVASALTYGVGYAVIDRDNRGYATQLIPVHFGDVERHTTDGELYYKTTDYGVVMPENMLEIANMQRMSPIRIHRENLGLAKAAQDFGSEYFGQKGQMTGVLASDQPLRKEQMDVIQNSWNSAVMNAGTKLLPFGFKYQRITITPDEAQFIETRKFQAEEICRIFSVPPSLVQLPQQTTFNNVEQQNLMFARHTIVPWARRIEQEIDRKLIQSFERPDVYSRFNMDDLHRGDLAARATFYQQALQNGWMSINEVRQRESLNPVSGGNVHTVQVNTLALDRLEAYSDKISKDEQQAT